MGVFLLCLFVLWLLAARAIYIWQFGDQAPASTGTFFRDLFTTPQGWMVIVWGNIAGFVFAVIVLATTVISFPLLPVRAVAANPGPMAVWGLIVAALLIVGSIPLFAGLAVVVPILGHATWHLYRKVVEPSDVPARGTRSRAKSRPLGEVSGSKYR